MLISRFLVCFIIIGLLTIFTLPVKVYSQPETVAEIRSLNLQQAMETAETANLDVLLSEERIREAVGLVKTTRSILFPEINVIASQRRHQRNADAIGLTDELPFMVQDTIGPNNLFDARFKGQIPLINLQAIQNWRAAKANQKLSEQELASVREEALMLAASLYLHAVRNQEALKVAEANIRRNERLLQLAQDKKEAGSGTALEMMHAEVQLSKSREQLEYVQMEATRSMLKLIHALGIDFNEHIELTDRLLLTPVKPLDFKDGLTLALEQRPDLIAQRQRELVALRKKDAATADWLPVVEALGDYGINGKDLNDTTKVWTIGVQLTLPVWDSFRRHGNLEQSKSKLAQAQNRTIELKRTIETQIRISLEELESRRLQVEVARETLRMVEEELQLANDQYEAGIGTNIEVIKAQAQVTEAEFREVENLFEYNLARVNWFKTLGEVRRVAE